MASFKVSSEFACVGAFRHRRVGAWGKQELGKSLFEFVREKDRCKGQRRRREAQRIGGKQNGGGESRNHSTSASYSRSRKGYEASEDSHPP
eukprot:3882439-Pleurochrysis_carterae.AAC.1